MNILIVGAGIAGTTLAHLLEDRNIAVELIDIGNNQSSAVAGGILNPLVFRRMTLSWRAEEFMPFAQEFYQELEAKFNQRFYHTIPIRRLFASEQEAGYWFKKQHNDPFRAFMKTQTEEDIHYPSEFNTFGTGIVLKSSFVDAAKFMEINWNYFIEKKTLTKEPINYKSIDPVTGSYRGKSYDYIIFCEGKDAQHNPWFGYLPIEQTKGEVLTIASSELDETESLNRKCFVLPIGNKKFRIGSTYEWSTDNTQPTAEGRESILANFRTMSRATVEIVDHVAGVRPTVPDRRPILGKHLQHPKLVIANGLGTKGYMLAPLLMKELTNHLLDGQKLDTEVAIDRFKDKHLKVFVGREKA